jgi:hypothetical protein
MSQNGHQNAPCAGPSIACSHDAPPVEWRDARPGRLFDATRLGVAKHATGLR